MPVDPKTGRVRDRRASPERRSHLRFPLTASAEVVDVKSGTRIEGRTGDLGLGGCYVDTLSPFPLGQTVSIRITRGNDSFQAKAKVVYSLLGMGMGLAFTAAAPEQVKVFQRWILELSGKTSPQSDELENHRPDGPKLEETGKNEQHYVLSELLIALIRKGVIDEADGKAMLQKLNR